MRKSGGERDRLDQLFLDHLAQQGECLAWHRLWPEYDKLSITVETLLKSSHHWMEFHPSIFVRCLEQRYSVTMLWEKVALQEMMRDGDTEEVVDMMSALSCSPALLTRSRSPRIFPGKPPAEQVMNGF